MKKITISLIVLAMITVCAGFSACSKWFHKHTVVEDAAVAATCIEDGLTAGSHCSECNQIIVAQEVVPATGHKFGDWIIESDRQYRACTKCDFREMQYFEERPAEGESNTIYGSYGNFDLFRSDCREDGKTLTYDGASNRLEVNLRAGTYSCNEYSIVIPRRVLSLRFVGETKGDPYFNLQIVAESRMTDLSVRFEDVRIESDRSIFVSETKNINVNIAMAGEKCSFCVTGKAANGATGAEAGLAGNGNSGKTGAEGASAMVVNGVCTIEVNAKILEIKGGEGGDGGKGSSAKSFGDGGKGGKGGNGGNGIKGENLVSVIVYSADCEVSVSGGLGGKGGKGGSGATGGKTGKAGAAGSDGSSGCEIIYNN